MKLVLAQMKHETNTFSPVPTPLARFAHGRARPPEGREAYEDFKGTGTAMHVLVGPEQGDTGFALRRFIMQPGGGIAGVPFVTQPRVELRDANNLSAFSLPKTFDDEAFALLRAVTGVADKQPRYKRCIDATQIAIGELLGKAYVDKHFPASSKQGASVLVDAIVQVMGSELAGVPWMSEPTRKIAQDKLAKLVRMIGYPEKWRDYTFAIKREDFAGNRLRAMAAETRRVLAKAGKPVDRGEWLMNAYEVNAYYNPTTNSTALLAGILQPPFFGADRSIAANMGGIGMVIGHELTHGFDDSGAQFDATGNLANWWAADDKAKFDARGKCLADQYAGFEAAPKQFVNGALTLGENIADLGGVKMAFKAYRSLRANADKAYVADGFSEDQLFFLAVGQAWCTRSRPAEIVRRLTVDPHAPPKFRIYGALRNLPEFAQAFSCAAGTPMRPAQACSVW